jgi:prophage regulatory protein
VSTSQLLRRERERKHSKRTERESKRKQPRVAEAASRKGTGTPSAIRELNQQYIAGAGLASDADASRNGIEARVRGPRGPPPQNDEEREQKREQRRRQVAESRERALAAVKAAGLRRILRLYEVEAATGKKRSQIYEDMAQGKFPQAVPVGERAVGWIESEILEWQKARIAKRDASMSTTELQPS